jgi:hypothetical protein
MLRGLQGRTAEERIPMYLRDIGRQGRLGIERYSTRSRSLARRRRTIVQGTCVRTTPLTSATYQRNLRVQARWTYRNRQNNRQDQVRLRLPTPQERGQDGCRRIRHLPSIKGSAPQTIRAFTATANCRVAIEFGDDGLHYQATNVQGYGNRDEVR